MNNGIFLLWLLIVMAVFFVIGRLIARNRRKKREALAASQARSSSRERTVNRYGIGHSGVQRSTTYPPSRSREVDTRKRESSNSYTDLAPFVYVDNGIPTAEDTSTHYSNHSHHNPLWGDGHSGGGGATGSWGDDSSSHSSHSSHSDSSSSYDSGSGYDSGSSSDSGSSDSGSCDSGSSSD